MVEIDTTDLAKKLKKIDPSDIRILVIGLVLLVIPVVIFFLRTRAPEGGFAGSGLRESLHTGRRGFSFVQQQEADRGGRGPAPASLYKSAKVDSEWRSAVETIARAPLELPNIEGMSLETKQVFAADLDPELRQANAFLNSGQLAKAQDLYLSVLARDTDNPFLKFYASANLCSVYERLGKTEELAKEFRRMVALMARLPKLGFEAELAKGLEFLRQIGPLMDKIQADGNTRLFVQQMLGEKGLSGKVTVDAVMRETPTSLSGYPGLDLLP
ncbi:MAG: hypothetical protein OZSIB_4219 [Candidatus Ozemobacter sibiricus]|jgi:hypothetical protein|uniref:Tetratricopeptide repeat protein n=1 Tax=Candidatus Ozemobacter sibiricus TaxID=2268124 RepID=A0A367ZMV8_9BACT|nr:MAG: hypothetical protein OZSIB_4219 [Candidatus Ozemobacter sibiricus]